MIVSIVHKGIRLYYGEGNGAKLPSAQLVKIRRILSMLDAVTSEEDIKVMGLGIHRLKGEYAAFWSLSVTGNYRIISVFMKGMFMMLTI